jgi:hypothetical protein
MIAFITTQAGTPAFVFQGVFAKRRFYGQSSA